MRRYASDLGEDTLEGLAEMSPEKLTLGFEVQGELNQGC